MKSTFTKLFILPFLLCTIISCSEGDKTSETNENPAANAIAENTETSPEEKVEKKGPFNIKSGVLQYEDKNLDGKVKAVFKLSFDNYGTLLKLEETAGGETSIYLFNDATKKGVTQFTGRKPSKIFMRQGEINRFVAIRSTQGFMKQDDEAILGKNCEVQANNAKSAKGESQLTYWIHEGIVLKEINRLGMGYIFEATAFEKQAIDKTIFSLPNGMELPHDIF